MAKVAKESPEETPKSDNLELQSDSVDVAKLVEQQLVSLRRAGLTHLPKGTGEFAFDFTLESEPASPQQAPRETSVQPAQVSQPAASPASVDLNQSNQSEASQVREAKPDLAGIVKTPPPARAEPTTSTATSSTTSKNVGKSPYPDRLELPQRTGALKVLQDQVAGCSTCPQLAETRTQTVFGVGNPDAKLVFLGEAPGASEDKMGEPFVGDAGQLLDKILGACGLSRSDVYMLNAVKCRPPSNRNPSQDELANCWGYAEQQLELLQPEFICCLGSIASRTLLKTTLSIGKLRRQIHAYRGSKVLVTYHPAYLLRTPSAKKHVWEDMKLLMQEMGIELPK